jgi:hypothetical protein
MNWCLQVQQQRQTVMTRTSSQGAAGLIGVQHRSNGSKCSLPKHNEFFIAKKQSLPHRRHSVAAK